MKRAFFLIAGIFAGISVYSQTVENIRVEPEGENIKINYRIGGSTESQLYNVYVTCSMDGGPRFEPASVIGDVGQNIRGGRSFYTVIWDIFEDVEEVGNAEFFVRVELVSDGAAPVMTTPVERSGETARQVNEDPGVQDRQDLEEPVNKPLLTPAREERPREEPGRADTTPFDPTFETSEKTGAKSYDRYMYVSYTGSQLNPYGFSFGTLRNWGVYGSIRLGQYNEFYELMEGSITAGLTKNFVHLGAYRLHGYLGAGIGDYFDTFDMEAGFSNILFNRLKLSVGFEYPGYYAAFVYGIGLIF